MTEKKHLKTVTKMSSNKSPGNDGITKYLYDTFWDELKISFLVSISKAFKVRELSTPQKKK